MSRRFAFAAGAAAALLIGPVLALAWDATGHETVARIAWEQMTPAARTRAVQLLRSAPLDAGLRELDDSTRSGEARDRELFMRAAAWADMVRDRKNPEREKKYHHGPWHYRNTFWEQDSAGAPIRDRPDIEPTPKGENAVTQLIASEASLLDASRPDSLRAIDLAWLMHLVGDIHQPLHGSMRITPSDPGGDVGGNRFRLDSAGKTNLHTYWDDAITREWPRGAADSTLDAYIGRVASGITRAYPPARFAAQLEPDAFDAWAKASIVIAKRDLYPTTLIRDRTPSDSYRARTKEIAEPAVALAGYRLADVLNRVLR